METTKPLTWRPLGGRSTPLGATSAGATGRDAGTPVPRAPDDERPPTLTQWLDQWLDLCANRGLRATTVEGYATTLRLYLPPELQAKALGDLTTGDFNSLYTSLLRDGRRDGGGLSPRTVRYLHTILSKALSDAVRVGVATSNPAAVAEAPSRRATRAPVFSVWSPAELARFLESAAGDSLYVAFRVAAATGLRRSELLGLRWCDVDLDARELRVVQALVRVRNLLQMAPPKTDRSRRAVALDTETAQLLAFHRSAAEASAEEFDDQALVFHRGDQRPMHPALFSYYFQRRVQLAGVRHIRFHDLRHTHATHALQAGIHPKVVSERLGHSTVTVTLDTYSHVLPGMQRDAAEAVAALLRG